MRITSGFTWRGETFEIHAYRSDLPLIGISWDWGLTPNKDRRYWFFVIQFVVWKFIIGQTFPLAAAPSGKESNNG